MIPSVREGAGEPGHDRVGSQDTEDALEGAPVPERRLAMRAHSGKALAWLIVILALSVSLRIGAAFFLGNTVGELPGTADQLSYHALALRLLGGKGFSFGEPWWPATRAEAPTAHWSFLYTVFLSGLYALAGSAPLVARLVQAIVVGLVQPLLALRLGIDAFGKRAGVIAAALTAVYAYFIYYAPVLMTESFYICAVLGSLALAIWIAGRGKARDSGTRLTRATLGLGLGLSLVTAVLLRQVYLLFVPFLVAWIIFAGRGRRSGGALLAPVLLSLAVLGATIAPITAFNTARFGTPVLLNTNAGFAFFWANHPIHGYQFNPILPTDLASYGDLIPAELSELNEAELDRELLRRGMQFVLDDPLRYASLSVTRVPAYFMFWPSPESSLVSNLARMASFGLLWPLMLFGLLSAFIGSGRQTDGLASPAGLLALFVLVYSSIHLLTWALVRYRLPVDAVLLVFAGAGVDLLARKWIQWRAGRRPAGVDRAASVEMGT